VTESETVLDRLEALADRLFESVPADRPISVYMTPDEIRALLAVARAVDREIAACPKAVRLAVAPLLRPADDR
jgi:hypothetical protein